MNCMIYISPFVFSISFITVFHFSEYKSFTSLFRYIPRYFIFSDVIINSDERNGKHKWGDIYHAIHMKMPMAFSTELK